MTEPNKPSKVTISVGFNGLTPPDPSAWKATVAEVVDTFEAAGIEVELLEPRIETET